MFEHKIPNFKEPVFDKDNLEENKNMIKSAVKGIFDKKDENVFYKENLSQEYILKKAKKGDSNDETIATLDLYRD